MMRRAYSFSARGRCETSGVEVDALCVFYDTRNTVSALAFFDELETSLRETDMLPDCVVIIADVVHTATLHSHWTSSTAQRESFIDRGRRRGVPFVKAYYFVTWCPTQGLHVRHTEQSTLTLTPPLKSFVDQGLGTLVGNDRVVQVAPAGHVFKHPSKTVNKLFIQARELASSEAEIAFVGRCIASALPALVSRSLRLVYVDTMGIYAFLREALTFANVEANILSFHSYEELDKLSPPSEPYAVVISASTSGRMAKQLVEEQSFDAARMLTLIDASRDERISPVLAALDKISSNFKAKPSDGTETQIELFGEHFSSKAKPPRAVTLGLAHAPKRLRDFLKEFGLAGLDGLNTQANGSGDRRAICMNSANVGANRRLETWLHKELEWYLPAAVDHVIHADDPGSLALATSAALRIQFLKGASQAPRITSYSAIKAATLANTRGVLVVQAVTGDGGLLREISRDLREFLTSEVPRHFLVAVALPQSKEAWLRVQQFLVRNPTSREYGFSEWLVLPVGADGTSTPWADLNELAGQAQISIPAVAGVAPALIQQSVDLAIATVDAARAGFLPTSAGAALALTDGFLFFGDVFDGRLNQVPVATTYATIAAVLQSARELNALENQLKPTGYESVVLSSENFLRFNDNILQGCLLRAAHQSELDYSSSPQHSRLMKEFLLKVFARHATTYGAAALEFAAALACGRMKLTPDDMRELKAKCIVSAAPPAGAPSALLGLLYLIPV